MTVAAMIIPASALIAAGAPAAHRPLASHGLPVATLTGVAATSAGSAWAVGFTNGDEDLILHWNGVRWTQVSAARRLGELFGVAATSASGVWAVGTLSPGPIDLEL